MVVKYWIRLELIERVSAMTSKYRETPSPEEGLRGIESLKQWASATKSFTDVIIKTLEEILKENDVQMNEEEEKALATYLRPTILELIQKHFR